MRIESFCLCRSVAVKGNNSIDLIGIFDHMAALGEPILSQPFVVAAIIRFFSSESGSHRFQIVTKNGAGTTLASSTEIVSISNLPTESLVQLISCRMGPTGLKFGRYDFSIEQNGKSLAKTVLYVSLGSEGGQRRFPVS